MYQRSLLFVIFVQEPSGVLNIGNEILFVPHQVAVPPPREGAKQGALVHWFLNIVLFAFYSTGGWGNRLYSTKLDNTTIAQQLHRIH